MFRSTIRSPQMRKKKKKMLYVKSIAALAFVALFVFGLSVLSNAEALQIDKVEGEGNILVTDEEIWSEIDRETQGRYLRLFSKKNAFLFPEEAVLAAVAARFPILYGAKIELKGLKTVRIKVSEREPAALWCRLSSDGAPLSDCFFIDRGGFIYSEAPEFKGDVYLKYYGSIDTGNPIGSSFLPAGTFFELTKFAERIKNLGLSPVSIFVKDDGDYNVRLHDGGEVYLNEREGFDRSLLNLESILTDQIGKDSIGDIDYIDLRFGNKVFFRLDS